VVLADVSLPTKSGYEICLAVKTDPRYCHARVVLTAGAMEPIDEAEASRVQADGNLRKPFEATAMLEMVKRFVEAANRSRQAVPETPPVVEAPAQSAPAEDSAAAPVENPAPGEDMSPPSPAPQPLVEIAAPEPAVVETIVSEQSFPVVVESIEIPSSLEIAVEEAIPVPSPPRWEIDPQAVRAAVTLALEAALPVLIDEVTQRVITSLADEEDRSEAAGAAGSAAAG
jgi:CheY-like chemotaxis protein